MLGSTETYNALNVTAITSLLDKRSSTDSKPALIGDMIIPAGWTAKRLINFYILGSVNFSADLPEYIYMVNCRATSMADSQRIAYIVAKTINRTNTAGAFFKAVVNQTIPPQDATDMYNTQVELTVYPHSFDI